MPELRQDPILGHWVIISEQRGRRPGSATIERQATTEAECAFCPGNERETLPEISALRAPGTAPDSPGWRVRVVPNKFPALSPASDGGEVEQDAQQDLFPSRPGHGHHEVIIEGEAHTRSVTEFANDRMEELVCVYRDRFRALEQMPGTRSATLIKNVGAAAGMSISHSHSQLIATPMLSPVLEAELAAAQNWARAHDGSCIWCDIIRTERQRGVRVVEVRENLVALCPWASRFPFETWILPVAHEAHFGRTCDATTGEFATLLLDVLRAIESRLTNPPYNYAIHSAPFPVEPTGQYHWRLAILPRVTRVAGYEQASGVYINHVTPEDAADQLRRSMSLSDGSSQQPDPSWDGRREASTTATDAE